MDGETNMGQNNGTSKRSGKGLLTPDIGVEYASTMVHGAPATKFPEYVVPTAELAHNYAFWRAGDPCPLNNSTLLLFEGFEMNLAILGLWKLHACQMVYW